MTLKWSNPLIDLGTIEGMKIERYERSVSHVCEKDKLVEHVFEVHDWGGEHIVDALQELMIEEIHGLLIVVDLGGKDAQELDMDRVAEQLNDFQPQALRYFFSPKTVASCKSVVLFINKSDLIAGTPAQVEERAKTLYQPLIDSLHKYAMRIDVKVFVGSASYGHSTHLLFSHFVEKILPKNAYHSQLPQPGKRTPRPDSPRCTHRSPWLLHHHTPLRCLRRPPPWAPSRPSRLRPLVPGRTLLFSPRRSVVASLAALTSGAVEVIAAGASEFGWTSAAGTRSGSVAKGTATLRGMRMLRRMSVTAVSARATSEAFAYRSSRFGSKHRSTISSSSGGTLRKPNGELFRLTPDCVSCRRACMRRLYVHVVGALLSGVLTCCMVSCEALTGTPMPGAGNCQYVPTLQACERVAERITETCLRECVTDLCTNAKIVCTKETAKECDATTQDAGRPNAGFVNSLEPRQTCQNPVKEINWCQLSVMPECQAMAMVHELAHACGWHEGGGQGVPGGTEEEWGSIECN